MFHLPFTRIADCATLLQACCPQKYKPTPLISSCKNLLWNDFPSFVTFNLTAELMFSTTNSLPFASLKQPVQLREEIISKLFTISIYKVVKPSTDLIPFFKPIRSNRYCWVPNQKIWSLLKSVKLFFYKKRKDVFLPRTQAEFSKFACVIFWAVKYTTLMVL